MDPAIAAIIAAFLNGGIEVWRTHANKPADWVPSAQDIADLNNLIDAASPEAVKAAAATRLGVPWPR